MNIISSLDSRLQRLLLLVLIMWIPLVLPAAPLIDADLQYPSNLFDAQIPVTFSLRIREAPKGDLIVHARWRGIDGKSGEVSAPVKGEGALSTSNLTISFGILKPGYYTGEFSVFDTLNLVGTTKVDFGVIVPAVRDRVDVLNGTYRFGLKKWNRGPAPWNDGLDWDEREAADAAIRLGLPWTRELFNQSAHLPIIELAERYPVGIINKIERFPERCFDEDRYGPIKRWEAKYGRGQWSRVTLPLEKPYKEWIAGEILATPPDQKVFEIWNEPWGKLPPEDFATLCSWIEETVRAVMPDAIVGPNIGCDLDPTSHNQWDDRFIQAGGLQGMDFVAIHPYTAGTPERKGFRQRIRNYSDYLRDVLGRRLPLYVTEFGWSTAPGHEAERAVSEVEQAARMVRQALMLYAEDVKVIIPHAAGQSERDADEREDWFGFFRLNGQPKPVAIAFGTAARIVDGSRYVGDIWFGPGIGAMLFERDNMFTLAIWTEGEDRELRIEVGEGDVAITSWMGETKIDGASDGSISIAISGRMTYLTGVGAHLAEVAVPPNHPLRDERWQDRAPALEVSEGVDPLIDGSLEEWVAERWQKIGSPKSPFGKETVQVAFQWSQRRFFGAVRILDEALTPPDEGKGRHYSGDRILLGLSNLPSRQCGREGFSDLSLAISGAAAEGLNHYSLRGRGWTDVVAESSGIDSEVRQTKDGWLAEFSIHPRLLDLQRFATGQDLTINLRAVDQDGVNGSSMAIGQLAPRAPYYWPKLRLSPASSGSVANSQE